MDGSVRQRSPGNDHAARYAPAAVAGWVGDEVILGGVDDDCAPVRIEHGQRPVRHGCCLGGCVKTALPGSVDDQVREVPGVRPVDCTEWVVMGARSCECRGAQTGVVDVNTVPTRSEARCLDVDMHATRRVLCQVGETDDVARRVVQRGSRVERAMVRRTGERRHGQSDGGDPGQCGDRDNHEAVAYVVHGVLLAVVDGGVHNLCRVGGHKRFRPVIHRDLIIVIVGRGDIR